MSMMSTNNYALRPSVFQRVREAGGAGVMTVSGAVNASLILTSLCAAFGVGAFALLEKHPEALWGTWFGATAIGLVLSVVMWFKPKASPIAAPAYAMVEGAWLGAVSLVYANITAGTKVGGNTGAGVVYAAAGLTVAILFAMLALYRLGIVRATSGFVRGVVAATTGVGIFLFVTMLLWMFGVNMSFAYVGPLGIAIAGLVVVLMAATLVIDFAFIEHGAAMGLPRYMEWYAGYGLLVTLVTMYVWLLRLLALLSDRRN